MLIITADDFGKTPRCTDNILKCFFYRSVTSVSAMVLMEDSTRAASLAPATGLEIGLHLNFTLPFTAPDIAPDLRNYQDRIVSYLGRGPITQAVYNPFLRKAFSEVFGAQLESFSRLYGRAPDFYNGHHHMHLCANVLISRLLPSGTRVRRTFSFGEGNKSLLNRVYREVLDRIVDRRFISTDGFFSVAPTSDFRRLHRIIARAAKENIEIEVHPEDAKESDFLLSPGFQSLIRSAERGGFLLLCPTNCP